MTTAIDTIEALRTCLSDTLHGYEQVLKVEPGSELAPLFRRMSALHLAAGDELNAFLTDMGEAVDEDGSSMSTTHQLVSDAPPMIVGGGQSLLLSFASSEERNLRAYDDALQAGAWDSLLETALIAQRDRLQAAIAEMRHMDAAV